MIIVQLSGDLGCQMFQYAFGRRLSLIHRTALKLDIGEFERTPDNYELDRFNIRAEIAAGNDVSQLINLHHLRGDAGAVDTTLFPIQTNIDANPYLVTVRDNTYLTGHCWTLRYFAKIKPYLRREFTPKTPPLEANRKYLKQIARTQSVAVYFYKKPDQAQDIADLPLDYYYRAVETIANRIKQPVFYLFSNAPAHFQEQFSINYPHVWLTQAPETCQYENFRLLRACKHQIIANAPFAWWPAWLNANKNKIVIAPRRWDSRDDRADDFLPPAWIRLDNCLLTPAANDPPA